MKVKHITRPLEIKAVADDGTFEGYGSVFNVIDSYRDIVLPGAFSESISEHRSKQSMPALLWQHDHKDPIGVWSEMDEDDHGLKLSGRLAMGTQKGRETYELLKMGAVRGLSIGFTVPKGGEEYNEEHSVWHLKQINLWETSIVTFPANEAAQVTAVKSAIEDPRDFERFLRDVGLTQTQAKRLMAEGYSAICPNRDGEGNGQYEAVEKFLNTIMR
jgi:uncharacterized protein